MKQDQHTLARHSHPTTKHTPKIDKGTDELTVLRRHLTALEKHIEKTNEILCNYLGGLSTEDMAKRIAELNLSDKSLIFLSLGIVPEKGDLDILMLIEEIKKRRDTTAKEDLADHINYTAL